MSRRSLFVRAYNSSQQEGGARTCGSSPRTADPRPHSLSGGTRPAQASNAGRVTNDAGLHQPLLQAREPPVVDSLWQLQPSRCVRIVGQQAQLVSYLIGPEMMAVQPRHFHRRFRPLTRASYAPPCPGHDQFVSTAGQKQTQRGAGEPRWETWRLDLQNA